MEGSCKNLNYSSESRGFLHLKFPHMPFLELNMDEGCRMFHRFNGNPSQDYFGRQTALSAVKAMSGQSIISIISSNLGPFGANSVTTFGMSFSIRCCTSIFQKLHRFPGN